MMTRSFIGWISLSSGSVGCRECLRGQSRGWEVVHVARDDERESLHVPRINVARSSSRFDAASRSGRSERISKLLAGEARSSEAARHIPKLSAGCGELLARIFL